MTTIPPTASKRHFMVRTADAVYLVETKAQQQTNHPNVQRKRKAAATWCSRINELPPYDRGGREWHYALVGESLFDDWRNKHARIAELLPALHGLALLIK